MTTPPKALHESYRPPPLAADHPDLVRNSERALEPGLNVLCADASTHPRMGVSISVCRLENPADALTVPTQGMETALVPLRGSGTLSVGSSSVSFDRSNWKDMSCWVGHVPSGVPVRLTGGVRATEIAVVQTTNEQTFPARIYRPSEIASEHRGSGFADDLALRIVRTAFDHTNKPPGSVLTLGEVVNFPGKWSSYPGHVHPQPEWYLYQFEKPGGYGIGRNGDHPYEVQHNDVLRIHPNHRHEQVAAPNFWMYYLWVVRDLPEERYTGFTYQDQRHVNAFWGQTPSFSSEK